ncbi:MAG: IS200/IS605 family transposase [Tannerellaceae bacterium]|nr:IS200/IS605 family transposase [Tannerellaceae bacterium]
MAQSLTQIYVHIIFHIKRKDNLIRENEMEKLYAYIGSVIKSNDSIPILVNGTNDHVHVLCSLSKNIALSQLVQQIKQHSSRWLTAENSYYRYFEWQRGYGAFSVTSSTLNKTRNYIANQKKHHKKRSFREEYIFFLKEYKVDYNEVYLWSDE